MYEKIKSITSFIRSRVGNVKPRIGIVLGSGLGGVAELVENPKFLSYSDIEGFPISTVEGHSGRFVFGHISGVEVVCMQGRFHYYEGYGIQDCVIGVRVMGMLGIDSLIVSNAAGGMGDGFEVGDIMLIVDHINLLPNPLVGQNESRWGVRFVPMDRAYDQGLRGVACGVALESGVQLKQGVYLASSGPTYETAAEYKFFKIIGAHACGMSTVPEVIVANHMGIKVLGFSVITNAPFGVGVYTDHNEVQEVAAKAALKLTSIVEKVIYESYK